MALPMPRPNRSSTCRVQASRTPWPLHDIASTRRLEARALAATAPRALMARAGMALARLAISLSPHARRIAVLAGPGNNGGDGLVAALHWHRLGLQVQVVLLADPAALPSDAAHAWQQARQAGVPISADLGSMVDADLLVDGLLGLGASRAPSGDLGRAIEAANASGRPVLAIDLPSALHADTGQPLGAQAIRATWTLSLLTLKPGLFTASGRDHAGDVWLDTLDISDAIDAPTTWLGASCAAPPPGFARRRHAQHKGSFGDLIVSGGATGMQGAAMLAAGAALTAGAGRVYLALLGPDGTQALPPDLMRSAPDWLADDACLRRSTVVCGCGGGAEVAATLPRLLAHAGRLLVDADALNHMAVDAGLQAALAERAHRGQTTVLTPHPLEAARWLACSTAEVQADRLRAANQLARRTGAVVVLKGSGTVIAAPDQVPWINATGNARLAAPGSGDVLAGWLGGLWSSQADLGPGLGVSAAWFAARAATWLHGRAADQSLKSNPAQASLPLRAADLARAMAQAMEVPG